MEIYRGNIPVFIKYDTISGEIGRPLDRYTQENIIVSKKYIEDKDYYMYRVAYFLHDWGEFEDIKEMLMSDDKEIVTLGRLLFKQNIYEQVII